MDETTTSSQSTSTSSAPAAPATTTTAPSASPAPTSRPSFKAALQQAETSTAAPVTTDTDTTDPTAQAITPPAKPKGPIPFDVHHTALENARKKTRDELEATTYAWTKGLNPEDVKTALGWRQRAQSDLTGFLQELVAEGLQNPQQRQTILSLMGQNLNAARQPATNGGPKPGELPKPRFQTTDDQGNAVPVYTAEDIQQLATSLREELRKEMQEEVKPFKEERQLAAQKEQLTTWRTTTLGDMRQLDGFKEHEAEIKAAFAAMPPTTGGLDAEANALYRAYTQVVIPHLKKQGQDDTLAKLKRDAAATTLNPSSSAAVSRPPNFKGKDGLKKALEYFSEAR